MDMENSEIEFIGSIQNDMLKIIEKSGNEVDIFLENCSSLYNLILDSLHNLTTKTISCECLEEMTTSLENSAKKILADRPEAEQSVLLRLNTICCAMKQLRVQHHAKTMSGMESDASSSARSTSSTAEMRNWLHDVERRLEQNERRIRTERPNLNKLLTDQQALQLEIQREGQLLVNRLSKQDREEQDTDRSSDDEKRRTCVDAIRKRWHTIYLNSLSLVCRIEEILNYQYSSDESETDPDFIGPPVKRARTKSDESLGQGNEESEAEEETANVLPFAESEYESIMDARTVTSCTTSSSDDQHHLHHHSPRQMMNSHGNAIKWDSVQQDIGYSSGENSIHEALNTCADNEGLLPEAVDMRRKRIECSPVKAFYRTVQLEDMSDLEVSKAINHDVDDDAAHLSDSVYVNHDMTFTTSQNLPEYDEVMELLDNGELPTDVGMTESFNTNWKEIHGQKKISRRSSRISREQLDLIAKSSCDASSEDSSECEKAEETEDLMSISFNSACFETSSPLKRQRSGRGLKHSSLLTDSLEMDGSFCSTRSEMPPCKSRTAARRKIRIRRMPRSMSDGEQLGVVSNMSGLIMATPKICVSPPMTPTRSTTRLLRRLDDQLRNNMESDTAPEHSDAAQAYEWDEYNPPQKDDSVDDMSQQMSNISNDMLNIDDDFTEHFGSQNAMRFIEESKSHLRVVQNAFSEDNVNVLQMSNFEIIARSNLRQVDQALKLQSTYPPSFLETSTLQDLKNEWTNLYELIRSPFARIMHQVKKFASTLQEVSSLANFGDVIDIQSKEDIIRALEAVSTIERRLSNEREELKELVASQTFKEVAEDLSKEFVAVSDGYDDAVDRIGKMTSSLAHVKNEWDVWSQRQNDIRSAMVRIESHLRDGAFDNKTIADEMELCQERMDSLETMCNYLTDSLTTLQNDSSEKSLPDFKAELSIYGNALAKLKDRFNEITRVPTPPSYAHPQEPQPTLIKTLSIDTQTMTDILEEPEEEIISEPATFAATVSDTVSSSRLIKFTFALSLLSALAAIFYYHIFGRPYGPHVTYVNGPPPV